MQTKIMKNGLTVIYVERNTRTVCIEVNVNSGSNSETAEVAGISHFIEHMIFEGTPSRPNSFEVSNEIESLGGDLNAATSNERTLFYVKVLDKHFDIALDVMKDILQNSLFDQKIIEKEKGIIADEIRLVNDQPRYYQWIMFQSALYREHPAKNPIYGTLETIKAIDRDKILRHYSTYYRPNNMTVVVVGSVKDVFSKVAAAFGSMIPAEIPKYSASEPAQTENLVLKESRGTQQSYMVLGCKTAFRLEDDSYALDVARAILGRGQSGKIFNEVRTKRGLAYDVGVLHNPSTDFGYFAVYVNTSKKNISKVRDIVLSEIASLSSIGDKELIEAKTFIEGELLLQAEDNQKMADLVASWRQADRSVDIAKYLQRIKAVKKVDVGKAVDRYFKNYTMTVIS
jgi:predicted Zn-dependent peptidase